MKKHDQANGPLDGAHDRNGNNVGPAASGRPGPDARANGASRSGSLRGGVESRSRSGLSGDSRTRLTVDRGPGGRSRAGAGRPAFAGRLAGIIIFATVLVVAFFALRPLVTGFLDPDARPTTRTTPPTTSGAAATSAAGTATSASTATGSTAPTTAPSATTTGTTASTVSAAARAQAFAAAKSEFEALVRNYKGRYALYYRNLANGETYAYNADQPFVAASSIKLGINTYLYTQIEAGKVSPTETLSYDSRPYPTGDYEAGTGTIQGQPNGTKYSVRDTSGLSIRISDNCATNMVIRRLGGIDAVNVYLNGISSVVDYRKSVSYKSYSGNTISGRHRSSATDLGLHASRLYELYKKNPALYGTLIDDLKKTEFDFGIQKGIPASVGVAHKIGTNATYNVENDVGIVFMPEPFVLAVMTESGSASNARQFQAKAAQIFYNYIDKIT